MILLVQVMERVQRYVLDTWQVVIAQLNSLNSTLAWCGQNEILFCVSGPVR